MFSIFKSKQPRTMQVIYNEARAESLAILEATTKETTKKYAEAEAEAKAYEEKCAEQKRVLEALAAETSMANTFVESVDKMFGVKK